MTASKVWEFRATPAIYASCCSSKSRLDKGNILIQFACCDIDIKLFEIDLNGLVVSESGFSVSGKVDQYRANVAKYIHGEHQSP